MMRHMDTTSMMALAEMQTVSPSELRTHAKHVACRHYGRALEMMASAQESYALSGHLDSMARAYIERARVELLRAQEVEATRVARVAREMSARGERLRSVDDGHYATAHVSMFEQRDGHGKARALAHSKRVV